MNHLERASLLMEQGRTEMAVEEISLVLATEPNNASAHCLFAICMSELEKYREANQSIATAVGLAPDSSFTFYAGACVSDAQNDLKLAEQQIRTAIQIDPYDSDFYSRLASILYQQKRWQESLQAAEQGLAIDPNDTSCINLRAISLVKLGRKSDADDMIEAALEREPENAFTHASKGWSLLENGDADNALLSFREALRLEPEMEWARSGIVEAMKGRYFIYRVMLGWFFWVSKLSGKGLWMVLVGGYIGYRFVYSLARNNETLRPYLIPVIVLYLGFVLMTWIAVPVFNLMLRLSKFGRMALSKEEIRISNFVGVCLLFSIVMLVAFLFVWHIPYGLCSLVGVLLVPLISTYYASDEGWPRAAHDVLLWTMGALAFSVCATILIATLFSGSTRSVLEGAGAIAFFPFVVLSIVSQFGVNFLSQASPIKGSDAGTPIRVVGGVLVAVLLLAFAGFTVLGVLGAGLEAAQP